MESLYTTEGRIETLAMTQDKIWEQRLILGTNDIHIHIYLLLIFIQLYMYWNGEPHRKAKADVVVLEMPVVDQHSSRLKQNDKQQPHALCSWAPRQEHRHTRERRRKKHCTQQQQSQLSAGTEAPI
jgi:hypothetical protein